MKRIPSLDGLRAVSILLVIIGHTYNGTHTGEMRNPVWIVLANGGLGVTVFFVISGFLITSLLLREHETNGSISLRNFYVRRVFRIFPAFYTYLLVLLLLSFFGIVSISRWDSLSALTFTWDYSPKAAAWVLEHVWSLSVEEQFYLFWPSILAFCLLRGRKRTATKIALALVIVAPFTRIANHFSGNAYLANRIPYMLHTRVDSLMFGCLTALLMGSQALEEVYRWSSRVIFVFPLFVSIISPLLAHRFGGAYIFSVGYSLEGASIALTMLWLVRNSQSVAGKVLNSPAFVHLGVISYSVYLWQHIFLHRENHSFVGRIPVNFICIFLLAEISYNVVEKKFLIWRKRFEATARHASARSNTDTLINATSEIAVPAE